MVQAEKIGAPFDQRPLFGGELRQPRADPFAHHGGVVAENHWIGEPAVEEFDGPLRGRRSSGESVSGSRQSQLLEMPIEPP